MKTVKKLILILFVIVLVIPLYNLKPTVVKSLTSNLSLSELKEIEELFNKNNFSLINLAPYKISKDEEGATQVVTHQIYQGLKVEQELVLNFETETGIFKSLNGYPVLNLPISNNPEKESNADLFEKREDLTPKNDSEYLRKARPVNVATEPKIPAYIASFLAHIKQEFLTYPHPLEARLVVYDKNSSSNEPQDWTLAWEITPKNEKYPVVLVDANTGSILDSFDGVYVEIIRQNSLPEGKPRFKLPN